MLSVEASPGKTRAGDHTHTHFRSGCPGQVVDFRGLRRKMAENISVDVRHRLGSEVMAWPTGLRDDAAQQMIAA